MLSKGIYRVFLALGKISRPKIKKDVRSIKKEKALIILSKPIKKE